MMKTLQYTYFKEYFDQQMSRKLKELQRFSVDSDFNLKKSKKITLNDIAHELGYKSPSSLSMIAQGDRLPSKKILNELFKYWKTPVEEQKSIFAMVKIESKLLKGKKVLADLNEIKKHRGSIEFSRIPIESIELIKDWYHIVIFELIGLPSYANHTTENFYKTLNKKVSFSQINKALSNLEKLGMIQLVESSESNVRYERLKDTISTPDDIPSEALRSHHKGMINRALDSIDEQAVDQRQLSGLTFTIKHDQIEAAKKDIQAFFSEMYEKYMDVNGDEIYQMNMQLFSHTPQKTQKRLNKEIK